MQTSVMGGCGLSSRKRLSICYMVPGHHLLASAGPTRNVLAVAGALSRWADVTVAFRSILEPVGPFSFKVIEIEPGRARSAAYVDDAAVRGIGYLDFISYLRSIRRFLMHDLAPYDLVLEKSWLLSGYVSAHCHRKGIPAALVENIVPMLTGTTWDAAGLARYVRLRVAHLLAGHYIRRTPLVIAETEQLKRALVKRWKIPPSRVEVVGLGVDRGHFRPLPQEEARARFQVSRDATVLLYAGVLDRTHDLAPIIDAFGTQQNPSIELHVVGDGMLRDAYEEKGSKCRGRIFFHGRVPYEAMPWYIAAADLCLAPYDLAMFPDGEVAYSMLKIPEYLAGARPVVSVPSGHILEVVKPDVSGFLFPNTVQDWRDFLESVPSRGRLKEMGEAALRTTAFRSWEDMALGYLSLCEGEVSKARKDRNSISGRDHGLRGRNEGSAKGKTVSKTRV